MKFPFSAIVALWFVCDLVLANSRYPEGMYSFDRSSHVTYKYDRMSEVQKQCASVLSASSELRYQYSVTGMKGELSFANGDWRQDEYFSPIYASCGLKAQDGFYIAKGYLFKEGGLCIPQGSIRKLLVKESHEGGLMGHFGIDKTLVFLKEKFFWPHVKKDVHRYCTRCVACLQARSKVMPHGLYTPLLIPSAP